MGLFDKLTGSADAAPGVVPAPADELRAALLALGEQESFIVGDGTDHHCDLIAAWGTGFTRQIGEVSVGSLKADFKVKMKFHPDIHEVHYSTSQSSSSWSTGSGGKAALGYNFNSSDVTGPLRDTATSRGWGWKFAMFKL